MSSDSKALVEAGCSFDFCQGMCDTPKLRGYGYLLQQGVCIGGTYSKSVIPEKGITKAYTSITREKIRNIDSRKEEMLIDITLTTLWVDPGIKTNFSGNDVQEGGIPLESEELNSIWKPDLYIYNNSDYKLFSDSMEVKTFRVLPFNESVLS